MSANCRECKGQCCQYLALELDKPETPEDFDHLRWYLAHRQVALFIDAGDWYLQVDNPCRFLTPEYTCSIYSERPSICREYGSNPSEEECHGLDGGCDHEAIFYTLEELENYLRQKGHAWKSLETAGV
jgi:uncharacterized protein